VSAPVATGLRISGGRPQTRAAPDGAVRVQHREFITNISSEYTFTTQPLSLGLNAGDTQTFPWLSKLAAGYERYNVHSMTFHYEPFVSTTESGAVLIQVDYDPADPAPATKNAMLNSLGATRSAVWMKSSMALNNKELKFDDHLFVRHRTRDQLQQDLKLYDVGTCFAVVTDNDAIAGIKQYGELWVSYDITLMVPAFHDNTPDASRSNVQYSSYPNYLADIGQAGTMVDGSTVDFTTSHNGHDECAITFREPFSGVIQMNQVGDTENLVELEPTPTPAGGWISKLAKLGGFVSRFDDFYNQWSYAIQVVADAGESLVLNAMPYPGDFTAWSGFTEMLFSPFAESLMGSLLLLARASETEVAQRVQSAGMNQILSASAVIPRKEYVDRRVNRKAELGDAGMDKNINSEKQNKNKYSTLTQLR
jgi:hypothetical protein